MKIRDVIRLLENDGWFQVHTRGRQRQYHHPSKARHGAHCQSSRAGFASQTAQ